MWRPFVLTTIIGGLWFSTPVPAQQNVPAPRLGIIGGATQEYRLGAGDLIEIQIVDAPELNQTVRVSASGEINFLSLGLVTIGDMSATEVESKIASALQSRRIMQKPQVLVFVKEYQAKRIYLMGEVLFPGEMVMAQSITAMDAILLAGGFNGTPDRWAYLHHHRANQTSKGPPPAQVIAKPELPQDGSEVVKIDLEPFLEGKFPEPDPVLREGDYLIVTKRAIQSFFVLGEVINPMNYEYPAGHILMITQAVAQAGGTTTEAKTSNITIYRKEGKEGKRRPIKVDFPAIVKGKKPNVALEPNDVVYVPSSALKIIKEDYITKTDLMAEGTAFRVGRYYQMQDAQR